MRISVHVGECMMFAVHRYPFFWLDPSGDPEKETEDESDGAAYRQGPVAQCSVQIDRGAHVGDLCDHRTNDQGQKD